jgi:putative nucleotidyltransferase with HDIG domain
MEKTYFPRKFKVYLPLIILFLLLVFLMPRVSKFTYDYKKGDTWMYETLVSQFDFPILKTERQLADDMEMASSRIVPYYRHDASVFRRTMDVLDRAELGRLEKYRSRIASDLTEIYSKGVVGSVQGQKDSSSARLLFVQKDRSAVKLPVSEVYTVETAQQKIYSSLKQFAGRSDLDSLYNATGLARLVEPDLIFDQQNTDLMYRMSLDNISKTRGVFRAGQTIISDGDIVTAEAVQILDSYKAEYEASVGYDGRPVFLWLGNILISLFLVIVLFLGIYYCNWSIFREYNKYLYLLMIFAIAAIGASLAAGFNSDIFYMLPFTLVALYLLAFFKKRMVFIMYFISLLPVLILAPEGVEVFVVYLVAGTVGMFVFEKFNRGWLQFVTAFIVFLVMVLVWTAFRFVEGLDSLHDYSVVVDMALGALLLVAGYPLIYLFEKVFMLVSASKLVELSDTSNKLLRLLADKAPGTFQHSLQVMNLADAAARAIDAYVPLVRAGALYHDVGKIANPQCFTENETPGVRFHADLSPKESAQEIIRHVADGLALADKYGLPKVLKDFIQTHHGTTNTAYFYNKYLNDGGDPNEVSEFYYDGVKPTTKEQVILMLCDTIEAASRSLKDYSQENISSLVDRIIEGKVDDGQLSNADISLKELNTLKEVIKSYLMQMHHSRVAYPKRRVRK